MSLFKTRKFTVQRTTGEYSDLTGEWVITGVEPVITIKGTLQPGLGRHTELLPEGRRTDEIYRLYTKTELKDVTQFNENSDRIMIDGIFEIIAKKSWQNKLINHYMYLVQKQVFK